MFNKNLTAAALGLALCGTASAFSPEVQGFEYGNDISGAAIGWYTPFGQLTALTSDALTVKDEGNNTTVGTFSILPVAGQYMGKLTVDDGSPLEGLTTPLPSISITSPGLGPVGTVWANFVSADYTASSLPKYNDYATLSFLSKSAGGSNVLLAKYTIDSAFLVGHGNSPVSGWQGFAVPTGATSLVVLLANRGDTGNDPTLYLDFAPVPEPESVALTLAGLAVAGLMMRRRTPR